jgi:hypothetical protein
MLQRRARRILEELAVSIVAIPRGHLDRPGRWFRLGGGDGWRAASGAERLGWVDC